MAGTDGLLVVGIGASAGGVPALRRFFEHVPFSSGIAYVVILHLSPDYEGYLTEVLQGSARLPVSQVSGRVKVQPDHVYVISPVQSLTIQHGHLEVAERGEGAERRAPVDIFFRALASSQGPHAACVILSGTGSDGSMGLKRIKEHGGLCVAQDPEEAEHGDMPRHAIATGLVDAVLPVAAIPALIIAYRERAKSVPLPEPSPEPPDTGEDALREIIAQLRARTGHDFSSYKRPTVLRRIARRLATPELPFRPLRRVLAENPRASDDQQRHPRPIGSLHQQLLELYAPPSLLVNGHHQLVHLSDSTGRYLQHPGGEPTADILKAIRPELRLELRAALQQAAHERTTVQTAAEIGADHPIPVTIVVKPVLRDDASPPEFFLVFFEESIEGSRPDQAQGMVPLSQQHAARQLEEEAQTLRAQLRATRERYETQAEELRASNEELQAMNEELRSSTEELETSKEELEALNEELRTVNQELKIKVEKQAQANDDIQNLINSTELGTIFLDRASRIKLFTPPALEIFNLIPADQGRALSDIRSALVDADLAADIERVIDRLERIEREVAMRDGRWIWMRMLPYRTADDRIDGVVLTFLDITKRKRAEDQLRRSEARLRLLMDSVTDYAIFTLDVEGRIATWNMGAARLFGYTDTEALGMSSADLFTPEDRQAGAPENERNVATTTGQAADERWHLRKDGSRFFASGVLTPLAGEDSGTGGGYVKVARDLTERKQWEDALTQAHADLEIRVRERTAQLAAANVALDTELNERRAADHQIRGLLRRLITAQEDERRRIARDLHDQLGQEVVGLRLRLSGILETAADRTLRERLDDALRTLEKLDQELDFHIWELRPPGLDDLGLVKTLSRFVQEWSREFGIATDFHSQGLDHTRLAHDTEINLYRITQEALNNVLKHARASRVAVILECRQDQLVLVIEDDGVGFEKESAGGVDRGIGLIGMQERAALIGGMLEIEASPGAGTTLFVRAPLAPAAGTPAHP